MIDTCKFEFKMTDRVRRCLCAARNGGSPNVKIYGNCFYVNPRFKTDNIHVYFDLDKMRLWVEASLPKVIQGHNVFGSNCLEVMCIEVIKMIYEYLELKFTPAEEQGIRKARIRLLRLDITCSFRLASEAMVSQVLECLYEHFRAEGKSWSAYGREAIECLYSMQNSTRVTDKFYNKGKELLAPKHGIPDAVPERERIERMASQLLRFEYTMRGKELTGRGLNFADTWNADLVKEKLFIRLKKFKLQGVIQPILEVDELSGLSENRHVFYSLWAEGADLHKHRGYRTLDRVRESLLADHRVDIYRPAKTGCPISLRALLDPSRAYFSSPKSLVHSGAVFSTRIS